MGYTLARLVFDSVIDSITIPNIEKNFQAFLDGVYRQDMDFSNQYASVMSALNLGLSRLVDNHKIPYQIEEVELTNNEFTFDKGRVLNVFIYLQNGDYERFEFRTLGVNKYRLILLSKPLNKVYVEYEKMFPVFTLEDCIKQELDENNELINKDSEILDALEVGIMAGVAKPKQFRITADEKIIVTQLVTTEKASVPIAGFSKVTGYIVDTVYYIDASGKFVKESETRRTGVRTFTEEQLNYRSTDLWDLY